jgi:hypothetical protein
LTEGERGEAILGRFRINALKNGEIGEREITTFDENLI